mmetsp:Transcript_86820/g.150219  ORF Transcript_86820/g.150219 Transcript_86820/m.150219 type:complete len:211 (-) Transcript_86820:3994-4626(-)
MDPLPPGPRAPPGMGGSLRPLRGRRGKREEAGLQIVSLMLRRPASFFISSAIRGTSASMSFTFQISALGKTLSALLPKSLCCHMFHRARAPSSKMRVMIKAPHWPGSQTSGTPKAIPQSRATSWTSLTDGPDTPPGLKSGPSILSRSSCVASSEKRIKLLASGATGLRARCSCCSPFSMIQRCAVGGAASGRNLASPGGRGRAPLSPVPC